MALTLLRFALRGVLRHRRRSLLVVSALAGGLFVLVFLKALQEGFVSQRLERGLLLSVGHVSIRAQPPADGFDPAQVDELLRTEPRIEASAPRVLGQGFARSASGSAGMAIVGVDPQAEAATLQLPSTLVSGAFLPKSPMGQLPPVVLGADLAQSLDLHLGDRMAVLVEGRDGSLHAEAYQLAGSFRCGAPTLDARTVYLRRLDARRLLGTPDPADQLVLRLDDPLAAPAVARHLAAALADRPTSPALAVTSWEQDAPELHSAMEMLRVVEAVRTAVLFVLVGLGALNAVAMSVFERRREFGVLMAIGMRPGAVLKLLLCEMGLLATAGVALGALASLAVVTLWLGPSGLDVSSLGAELPGALAGTSVIHPLIRPSHLLWSALWVAVLSLTVLFWPAWRLLRLDPSEALRERS